MNIFKAQGLFQETEYNLYYTITMFFTFRLPEIYNSNLKFHLKIID